MAQFRKWIGSNVRRLAGRLEDLGDMLATIHLKLHDAIADAVSRTITTVAHDVLLAVLDRLAPPGVDPDRHRGSLNRNDRRYGNGYDRYDDDDPYWNESDDDGQDYRDPASTVERPRAMKLISAAGLQVGAWAITQLSGRKRIATTAVAAVLLACSGLFSPAFAIAGAGILLSASRMHMMTDLLRSFVSP